MLSSDTKNSNNSNYFAIRSQRVVTSNGIIAATVIVKNGLIDSIDTYDCQLQCPVDDIGNKVLMPGLVDSHVHINEPGRTEWEGFNTATQAAAAGGITTLVDMPLNCIPVTINKKAFDEKLAAVSDKLWVDCGFWGGVIPDSINDLEALLEAGVLGVKSFLIDSGIAEFPNMQADDLRKAMPILAKHNVPYLIHAELDCTNNEPAEIGRSYQSFLASRPKSWENDAINMMINLNREVKKKGLDCHVHIVHLSSAEAISNIKKARAEGQKLTIETCPHYLTLFSESIPDGKTLFKCCPPIRENENRHQLWQGLKEGVIDFIVSDHSPCTPQLKHIDTGDIEKAWGGISALQFGLPLIWTQAKEKAFDLTDIAYWMSAQTAKFIGMDHIKGHIKVGYHADFMVFDDVTEYKITNEMIKHKNKITPYEGRTVTGLVERTYLRGQIVYDNDKFINKPVGQPLLKGRY
ncbi:allantoinase AllB [Pseudoalteromonas denitrificans]|uniref:allantoinase n=1 Tax=Pseudoalteromonas denitrificans DSM 6059 TaxID=1123010 RepID=A0A1I1L658_9GAMM|nr:allantoinase AllB [Pseudoalteromonas denitrificans]SFC68544.1 allantoinase [Pseudoalteromonas denitrificans DSM 6059]